MKCKVIFAEAEGAYRGYRYYHRPASGTWHRVSAESFHWFSATGLLDGEAMAIEIVTDRSDHDADWEWSLFGWDDDL